MQPDLAGKAEGNQQRLIEFNHTTFNSTRLSRRVALPVERFVN